MEKRIVFTNGCFDLFHIGHLKLLKRASHLGSHVIVGINSDESVRRLKGKGRPIISQKERADIVLALTVVDQVIIFDEDTPIELIKSVKPDVLVKGGDWEKSDVVGADFVEGGGGEVVIIPLVEGASTTNIIEAICIENSV